MDYLPTYAKKILSTVCSMHLPTAGSQEASLQRGTAGGLYMAIKQLPAHPIQATGKASLKEKQQACKTIESTRYITCSISHRTIP